MGFTLVELMVTLALTLFLLALCTGLFVAATQGISTSRGIAAADQRVRQAVATIRKDLHFARIGTKARGLVTPAKAFLPGTYDDYRPNGGYFLIEENSPAIRQGVDDWGQGVEVDTDDVLGFTQVRPMLPGDVFYARVPRGGFLDNFPDAPSRFDQPNNGLVSSNMAETVFFLRPDRRLDDRQTTLSDVRGFDVDVTTQNMVPVNLVAPVTYTLYRRQLVILPDRLARAANGDPLGGDPNNPAVAGRDPDIDATNNANNPNGAPLGPPASARPFNIVNGERKLDQTAYTIPNGQTIRPCDYYQNYAVAGKPDTFNPNLVHFVRFNEIDERRNRFGIDIVPGSETPYSWSTSNRTSGQISSGVYPAFTLFRTGIDTAIGAPIRDGWPAGVVPAGNSTALGSSPIFELNVPDRPQWLGRPTSLETNAFVTVTGQNIFTLLQAIFCAVGQRDLDNNFANGVLDDSRLSTTLAGGSSIDQAVQSNQPINYPHGDDVLLNNVLSFDVKVYDDDPRVETAPVFGALVNGSPPTTTVNPHRVFNAAITADQRAPEFIDLGYRRVLDAQSAFNYLQVNYSADFVGTAAPTEPLFAYRFSQIRARGAYGIPNRWRNIGTLNQLIGTGLPPGTTAALPPTVAYDTWSDDYAIDPLASISATNPLRPIPYPKPLRGIQLRLRVLEPVSGVVREVSIVHCFDED